MKKIFIVLAAILCLVSCNKKTQVASPEGKTIVSFMLTDEGKPQYSVEKEGKMIILPSDLGFNIQGYNFSDGFKLISSNKASHNETWETTWGEEQYIVDNHNEMTVHLKNEQGLRMDIIFRAFNDGFAFRYAFPEQEGLSDFTILDENTSYRFAEEPEAWSIPWRTEYYEALWTKEPISQKDTTCSPITLEMADGSYAFLHEAAIYDYPAENFYFNGTTICTYLTPWRDAELHEMEDKAYVSAPFATPWRFMILTPTLSEMVASRIMLNLNEPCKIDDTSWIQPMKFIGIWWGMHMKNMTWRQGPIHGATTANMERYLQFAADHNFGGVLAEGWNTGWEGYEGTRPGERFSFVTPYDDYDIDYLAQFAHDHNVEIVFHHETSGHADQYQAEMEEAYKYMQKYGMHSVKTGYVAPIVTTIDGPQWNKGQSGVRHYRQVIETSAKYHVCIDNHEPVMPSGIQRTYPNLFTQEGIRGQEWNAWAQDGGSPCEHATVLPFTRFMAGPADYTPGVFAFENPIIPGTRVHSTLMNQLGLFVCFYSPLQMACDLPENYMKHPDAFKLIEDVPCDWKKTIMLDGTIGDFCVFAREDRNSSNWFVGGITDEESRETIVDFSFLKSDNAYDATIYRDAEDADWESNPYAYIIEHQEITSADKITIPMAAGGGFAISLIKK